MVETKLCIALLRAIASMRENLFLNDVQAMRSRVQHRIHGDTVHDGARDRAEDEIGARSDQEQHPIALIAGRITELDDAPDFSSEALASTCATSAPFRTDGKVLVVDLIKEDTVAECIAMDVCCEVIRHLGDSQSKSDPRKRENSCH